jgi:V/A-type H+-transporting ATPase subunit E
VDGMNAIVEHIMAGARQRASQIEAETAAEVHVILIQAEEACDRIKQEAEQKAQAAAEAVISRAASQSALESRRSSLVARQNLIEQVIEFAVDQLCNLGESEKIGLYTRLLQALGAGSGLVTVNAKDQRLMSAVLTPFSGQFELAAEPGNFSGGVMLRRGRIEENLTFDLLVRNKRPQLVALAAGILFPEA